MMPIPSLSSLVRQAASPAVAPLPAFEVGTVVTVVDGSGALVVEASGVIVQALRAGDEPFRAGDRVTLSRRAPNQGGDALVHGYA
jgi:hypothetical protein